MSSCTGTMTTTNPDGSKTVSEQPGSMFGPSSYDIGYQGMYVAHKQSETARAAAINSQPCAASDASCPALKILGIAMMSMEKFDVKAPTTGFDVLSKGVDVIVPVAGFYSLYKLGVSGITNAGSKFGDNATVTNSMNHTDPTSTTIGAGSSTSSGTSTPSNVPATDSYNVTNPVTATP